MSSQNFAFLGAHDPVLDQLGGLAERYFASDPSTCLFKLRQFGEVIAKLTAANLGIALTEDASFLDTLRACRIDGRVDERVLELFHALRTEGNDAAHRFAGDHRAALANLKIARQIGIWFHRSFGCNRQFKPEPFAPPPDPQAESDALRDDLAQLRSEFEATASAVAKAQLAHAEELEQRRQAEDQAQAAAEERRVWQELAEQAEARLLELQDEVTQLRARFAEKSAADQTATAQRASEAAGQIELSELETRKIIDQQLRARGWEADTTNIRFSAGYRPTKGRNLAIAEWPTGSGPADYAFFVGAKCVATVEAKRKRKNVSAAIDQAERYSRDFVRSESMELVGGPWGTQKYQVPFVFASNGRPYLKQLETESGIWFRDTRKDTNHRRALVDWPTPEGLLGQLEIDRDAADRSLATQGFEFGFPLRPYQRRAIETIEGALANDARRMLVAMATGTGKTKLAIALLYRLLTAKRFRRVCFVVDRNALGQQTAGEFSTTRVVSGKTFADIFGLKRLEDAAPDTDTKVHICTIQGLVKRVLYQREPGKTPPVDQYDLMIVDECHRGYLLDREMADSELSFRDQADYISKYRRVLEHFDAVKIGLTATPALHTVEIFGDPIFKYSYREAVIDGYLIDHEPPVRIETALARAGIKFRQGERVELLNTRTGEINLAHAPDEISFDVGEFNRKVVTVEFNRVVASELATHIAPALPGKTLVFAVSDAHADIIVNELRKAFAEHGVEDAAIRKVTGSVDRVGQLIRAYRNDALPNIAVTVDLLTTGIDVPKIVNLVFLRRVNSRILYEQMLGRGTRCCDEIGKETFRIFDAVDLYANLENLSDMKPVVVDPTITLEQLFEELTRVKEEAQRETIRAQIIVKMARQLRKLPMEARDRFEAVAGETPDATLKRFKEGSANEVADWARTRTALGSILDWAADGDAPRYMPISPHADQVVAVSRGYGKSDRPEDFLDSFTAFVRNNLNRIAALKVVVQRPRELSRQQLRELRLELDRHGFSEANLRRAWRDAKNEDIIASIIGFIRQAALGDPLLPFAQRVRGAMERILRSRAWTDPQRKWLQRIGEQIEKEIVVDREALDQAPFDKDGGFNRLNRVFGGDLEAILTDINEELWKRAS